MRRLLIGRVLTPYRSLSPGAVLVEGRKIVAVGKAEDLYKEAVDEVIDFSSAFVSPGFIDIHLHGGGGKDTMDASLDALRVIAWTHAKGGTTSFYPTTLTASLEHIEEALKVVRLAMELEISEESGARVLGAHVEGPYFNEAQAGAQNPRYLKTPDEDEIDRLLKTGAMKRISLAPELPGSLEVSRKLSKLGVVVSIGHSNALIQDVVKSLEYGFSHVTHIYSGMSLMRRERSYRLPGVLEATLLLDELTTEIIADSHHLPPSLMRLVLKTKGIERVCGITDAMSAAGLGPGEYELGGLKVIVENDVVEDYEIRPTGYVAKLSNKEAFAGSVALMIDILRNIVELAQVPLQEGIKMVTTVPARIMNIEHERGRIAPGYFADVTVFNEEFEILLTMVEGVIVYRSS
ncbi:MAG: N-acetylglucosamine-6-phosphate deacetylase [Thermotogota bacterium]|nr:N-acetylglucosamine-6-phosphate deacetylase [Thermotogota bacterium]